MQHAKPPFVIVKNIIKLAQSTQKLPPNLPPAPPSLVLISSELMENGNQSPLEIMTPLGMRRRGRRPFKGASHIENT